MPETLVACGGATSSANAAAPCLELDVAQNAPADRRIDFSTARISASLRDDLPDLVADALELAAYVYCADRLVTRRSSKRGGGIGSEWQRHFRFRIPVRRLDVWRRREVATALIEVLTFLSGDRFSFEFTQATAPFSLEPYLGFRDQDTQVIRPEQIILFSGGLDSLAGVASEVIGSGKSAVLVTHQSATRITNLQDTLGEAILAKTGVRQVFYVPVRVGRGSDQPREHTQRLRSFLFATLGLAYAKMFGLNTVRFCENGITSFNLPVAEHVLGTRASRTTHPRVLSSYSSFFSLLLDEQIDFENPFLFHTKADIVRLIAAHGCKDLIPLTTSCASVRQYSMTGKQCGTCSQCVERRVAMIAAGLDQIDAEFGQDMFVGPVQEARDLTMIEGHLLRANRLGSISKQAFLTNHGQIFRALGTMGMVPDVAAQNIYELHRRYGQEFIEVVERQFASYATVQRARQIHPKSLIGMLMQRAEPSRPFVDPVEREIAPSRQGDIVTRTKPKVLTIALAVDHGSKKILFSDGVELTRNGYRILEKLVSIKMAAAMETGPEAKAPFTLTKSLAAQLATTEENLRQIIERTRKKITDQYEKLHGYTLDEHDLIETHSWRGYRLNPNVVVAALPEVQRAKVSRKPPPPVTRAA